MWVYGAFFGVFGLFFLRRIDTCVLGPFREAPSSFLARLCPSLEFVIDSKHQFFVYMVRGLGKKGTLVFGKNALIQLSAAERFELIERANMLFRSQRIAFFTLSLVLLRFFLKWLEPIWAHLCCEILHLPTSFVYDKKYQPSGSVFGCLVLILVFPWCRFLATCANPSQLFLQSKGMEHG